MMTSHLDDLERLERLRADGAISEAEFLREKEKLLNPKPPQPLINWRSIAVKAAIIAALGAGFLFWASRQPHRPNAGVPIEAGNQVADAGSAGSTNDAPSGTQADPADVTSTSATAETDSADAAGSAGASDDSADVDGMNMKPGRCLLDVRGATYVDGPCQINLEEGGSFTIYEHFGQPGYFAMVIRDGDSASGYWNGSRDSDHADSELGQLTRAGACWQNDAAKICAWAK
jgi:hypothetical protein